MRYALFCAALLVAAQTVFAQHEGHTMPPKPAASPTASPMPTPSPEMPAGEMEMDMDLMPKGSMGSGTS